MNRIMLAGAALAVLASTPAFAQSFQGPYVGVQAGGTHDIAINDKKDAFTGGVFAGYDYQLTPKIVVGAEGGFSVGASDRIGPSGLDQATIDPDYSFDLSARAGYVVGEKNLLYVRGGYANTRANVSRVIGNTSFSDKNSYDGWFVGGGVERKLLDNVSSRIEYRFNDFGSDGHDFQRHQVLLGVAYRF
jgi:outer membrane immunogenic protein